MARPENENNQGHHDGNAMTVISNKKGRLKKTCEIRFLEQIQ